MVGWILIVDRYEPAQLNFDADSDASFAAFHGRLWWLEFSEPIGVRGVAEDPSRIINFFSKKACAPLRSV